MIDHLEALKVAIEIVEEKAAALSFAQKWIDGQMPESAAARRDIHRYQRLLDTIALLKEIRQELKAK